MNLNDLYDLENEAYAKVSVIRDEKKREYEAYMKGLEDGVDLMFKRVREFLRKEQEMNGEESKEDSL